MRVDRTKEEIQEMNPPNLQCFKVTRGQEDKGTPAKMTVKKGGMKKIVTKQWNSGGPVKERFQENEIKGVKSSWQVRANEN